MGVEKCNQEKKSQKPVGQSPTKVVAKGVCLKLKNIMSLLLPRLQQTLISLN